MGQSRHLPFLQGALLLVMTLRFKSSLYSFVSLLTLDIIDPPFHKIPSWVHWKNSVGFCNCSFLKVYLFAFYVNNFRCLFLDYLFCSFSSSTLFLLRTHLFSRWSFFPRGAQSSRILIRRIRRASGTIFHVSWFSTRTFAVRVPWGCSLRVAFQVADLSFGPAHSAPAPI